jgi:3',5'-cyclic-AMP phosphodiesterase
MPITLPPTSRRRWLQHATAASFGVLASKLPAANSSEQLWVLFSDPHIAEDEKAVSREVCMAENLTRCVNQVLKIGQKPFGVIVNGDCTLLDGKSEDYATFARLMEPLTGNSIQVHCTLGNHDHRQNFINAILPPGPPNAERQVPVADKHVSVVSSATMNWVLLDSLHTVNSTPGLIGEVQLGWLDRTLRSLPNKPTLVVAHHNPQPPLTDPSKKPSGLQDADDLFKILASHDKVKGFIHGHIHNWGRSKHEATGLPILSLPPVAYTFGKDRPNGWILVRATAEHAEFELRSLNPAHDEHGHKHVIEFS